ncbi:MAG: nucleotidyltransferase family protein [Chloroflexota bacterium]
MDNQPKTEPETIRVAGVILAAGAAARMGQPKLLLPWQGQPLIWHVVQTGLHAGLEPMVVVTGAGVQDLRAALSGLPLQFAHNPDWQSGQSSSVRVGIQALPRQVQSVIFLLGDQPFVSVELLQALVQTYVRTRPQILAPFVAGKRSNPVLFDRVLFEAMCGLVGDAGARSLFAQVPPTPMPWLDERLSFDVDTPEDYRRLLEEFGSG